MKLINPVLFVFFSVSLGFIERLDIPHKEYSEITGANRPDVSELSDAKFEKYAQAIKEFLWGSHSKQYKYLIDKYRMHWYVPHKKIANNTPYLFINMLEKELQKIDPSLVIPAWNYTEYLGSCDLDPALSKNRFGAQTNRKGCLTDGILLPPVEANKGCLKRRSLLKGLDIKKIVPEEEILAANKKLPWKVLIDNSNNLSSHLWGMSNNLNDPLFISIQAYHFKLLNKLGKDNGYNIDLDFGHSVLGNKTLFDENAKAFEIFMNPED